MPERPEIRVRLVHLQGPFKGQIQDYDQDEISIGRHPASSLCFPSDLTVVSRKHAEIKREGNRFTLIDHSTNGTYVNGKSIGQTVLKNGDVLTFAEGGPKVSFLLETQSADSSKGRVQERRPPSEASPRPEPQVPPPGRHGSAGRESPGQPQRVKAPLIVQYGPTLRSYTELPVTIGSSQDCGFQLEHPSVLGRHAQIFYVDGTYWIKDLTGQSRVAVNKKAISTQAALQAQDSVALNPDGPFFVFLGGGRLAEAEGES